MRRLALFRVTTLPFETLAGLRTRESAPLLDQLLSLEERLATTSSALTEALHRAAGEKPAESDPRGARARLALIALKRDVHNARPPRRQSVAHAEPLITAELSAALSDYETLLHRRDATRQTWRRLFAAETEACRSELLAMTAEPLVQEGIRLASRSLMSRVRRLERERPATWGHGDRHVTAKAAAYLARFCTKTSPNGLFAATALAQAGGGPARLEGEPRIERVEVLLNVFEAGKVTACLAVDRALEPVIVPRPNSTLRLTDGVWTFWRFASLRNATEDETLCRVKDHPVLRSFIEESTRGARDAGTLIDRVAAGCGMARDSLAEFYRGLVDRGILIAEVEIPYNVRRPLRLLAEACRRSGSSPSWRGQLEEVEETVDTLPRLTPAARSAAMDRIHETLESLPHNRPLVHDELFRLDAVCALRLRLPESILADMRDAMRLYVRAFAAMYPAGIYRRRFEAKFLKRYRPDVDVALLDLYHGFVEPEEETMVRPAAFPDPEGLDGSSCEAERGSSPMRRLREFLARRARDAAPGEEIVLDERILETLVGPAPEPRWACGVLFQVAAPDWDAVTTGGYRLVVSSLFNGAGLALARFAHLHGGDAPGEDPITRELRRAWTCVRREGTVAAEVTYNHHARTANAGLRPSIFRYEIEMPGEKTSAGAEAIPLKELVVRYDSDAKRFVLRWPSRDLEIVPVISSGVDPSGITSFLVSIGQHGLQPVGYFPGFDQKGITRWPRISCGRVVLFRERWVFRSGEWPRVNAAGGPLSDADHFLETAIWRRRHGLPRHLFLHTSVDPKPRYLDLDSPLFVDHLRRAVAGLEGDPAASLHLTEMYPDPGNLWVADARGRYPSEFLVQMDGPAPRGNDA